MKELSKDRHMEGFRKYTENMEMEILIVICTPDTGACIWV